MRIADYSAITPNSELRTPNTKGFTLIETVITLVVLSIAAVGVLSVFSLGTRGGANPLLMNQATQLAQGEMDQLVGEKMANGFGAATLATGATVSCQSTMLTGFGCNRTICFVPAGDLNDISACTTTTDYKHVTVLITQAAIGSVKMETLVTNY